MKVKIEMTIDVNEKAYSNAYGLTLNEVREDVKTWVEEMVYDAMQNQGFVNVDYNTSGYSSELED